jgi:flagellar biosynthesis/type III secretory pathway M-ring protein FliF/YscJ
MDKMDAWNLAILLVAAYVAVMTLTRLMIRRRNQMLEQFRQEVEKEKRRRKIAPSGQHERAA